MTDALSENPETQKTSNVVTRQINFIAFYNTFLQNKKGRSRNFILARNRNHQNFHHDFTSLSLKFFARSSYFLVLPRVCHCLRKFSKRRFRHDQDQLLFPDDLSQQDRAPRPRCIGNAIRDMKCHPCSHR